MVMLIIMRLKKLMKLIIKEEEEEKEKEEEKENKYNYLEISIFPTNNQKNK